MQIPLILTLKAHDVSVHDLRQLQVPQSVGGSLYHTIGNMLDDYWTMSLSDPSVVRAPFWSHTHITVVVLLEKS